VPDLERPIAPRRPARDREASLAARAFAILPRWLVALVFARETVGRLALAGAIALFALSLIAPRDAREAVSGGGGSSGPAGGAGRGAGGAGGGAPAREPRAVEPDRNPLVYAPTPTFVALAPPPGGCAAGDDPRVLAARAELGPGVDVRVLRDGFGVGFASGATRASGVRVFGPTLRIADRVSVTGAARVRHVSAYDAPDGAPANARGVRDADPDAGPNDAPDAPDAPDASDAPDALALRVDTEEARTIFDARSGAEYRVTAFGSWVHAVPLGERAGPAKPLWAFPWGTPAARPAPRTAAGFTRIFGGRAQQRAPRRASPPPPDLVRAAAAEGGGAVVAMRRPSMLWVGAVSAELAPAGALAPISRQKAAIGTPSLVVSGGDGVVAWAERAVGSRDWTVMVASFPGPAAPRGPVRMRAIAAGMSPSVAALAGGGILHAYAKGGSGAHRVVVQRLRHDLEPEGDPVIASPGALNAGQPAAALGADGRGLVAFFAADRRGSSALLVTPLACAAP
jgi:hypothetical protein